MIRTIVVEDEPAALERYSSYVDSHRAFSVVGRYRRASEAERAVLDEAPELVVTDIRMPGEDGISFLERARSLGWKGMAVIVSGYDDFGFAQRSIRVGIFDYLLKPIFPEQMIELLDRVEERLLAPSAAGAAAEAAPADGACGERLLLRAPDYIVRAKDFVDRRGGAPCGLEETAMHANVSPSRLSAEFRRFVGLGFVEYARRRRIEFAKRLIETTNLSLKEIAERLSYPDVPTFAKAFKREAGIPPGAYRRGGASDDGAKA
jgi:two-component system, response regulator YesN